MESARPDPGEQLARSERPKDALVQLELRRPRISDAPLPRAPRDDGRHARRMGCKSNPYCLNCYRRGVDGSRRTVGTRRSIRSGADLRGRPRPRRHAVRPDQRRRRDLRQHRQRLQRHGRRRRRAEAARSIRKLRRLRQRLQLHRAAPVRRLRQLDATAARRPACPTTCLPGYYDADGDTPTAASTSARRSPAPSRSATARTTTATARSTTASATRTTPPTRTTAAAAATPAACPARSPPAWPAWAARVRAWSRLHQRPGLDTYRHNPHDAATSTSPAASTTAPTPRRQRATATRTALHLPGRDLQRHRQRLQLRHRRRPDRRGPLFPCGDSCPGGGCRQLRRAVQGRARCTCQNGRAGLHRRSTGPSAEVCDGADNNCDGTRSTSPSAIRSTTATRTTAAAADATTQPPPSSARCRTRSTAATRRRCSAARRAATWSPATRPSTYGYRTAAERRLRARRCRRPERVGCNYQCPSWPLRRPRPATARTTTATAAPDEGLTPPAGGSATTLGVCCGSA